MKSIINVFNPFVCVCVCVRVCPDVTFIVILINIHIAVRTVRRGGLAARVLDDYIASL